MSIIKRLFRKKENSNVDLPYPLLLARSKEELALMSASHDRLFHFSSPDCTWAADLDVGEITFTTKEIQARAAVQIVGSIYKGDGTWLWAWANTSIPEKLCTYANAVKAYGEKHGIKKFTTRKFQCSEAEGWDFTALACKLGGGQGAYCGPDGDALVFMSYDAPSISKV